MDSDELLRLPPSLNQPSFGNSHTLFDALKEEFFDKPDWHPDPIDRLTEPHGAGIGQTAMYTTGICYLGGFFPLVLRGVFHGVRKPIRGQINVRKRFRFMEVSIKKQLRHTRSLTLYGMTLGLLRGVVPAVRGKKDFYNDVIAAGLAGGFFASKHGPRMVLFAGVFVSCFAMVATTAKVHAAVKQNYPAYFYDPDVGFPKEFRRKDGTLFWQNPKPAGWTPDQDPPKPEKLIHPMPFLQEYDYDEDLEASPSLVAAERVMSKMGISLGDIADLSIKEMEELGDRLLAESSFSDLDALADADGFPDDFGDEVDTVDYRRPQYPAPVYDDEDSLNMEGLDI